MLLKADTITKDYVKDASIFADIFNYYIYGGRQIIQPDQLTERDSTKIALSYGADGAVVPVQKFRDVQKLYAAMTDGEIMKFQSSLREVMFFIKYSKDQKNSNRILKANEKRFRELERRAADVIEVITNSGMKYDEDREAVDVCQAIQEMRMKSEQDGERRGELKKAQEAARNFYDLGIDIEKIAQGVGYAVETVKQWIGLPVDD